MRSGSVRVRIVLQQLRGAAQLQTQDESQSAPRARNISSEVAFPQLLVAGKSNIVYAIYIHKYQDIYWSYCGHFNMTEMRSQSFQVSAGFKKRKKAKRMKRNTVIIVSHLCLPYVCLYIRPCVCLFVLNDDRRGFLSFTGCAGQQLHSYLSDTF